MVKIVLIFFSFNLAGCSFFTKKTTYNSVVLTEYGALSYSTESIYEYKKLLKDLKLKNASLLFTCHTKNKTSENIDCSSNDSPSKIKVFAHLKDFKDLGFSTSIRIYVDLLSGDWRAYWDPEDKTKAFANLKRELVNFAKLAEQNKVDLLIIGAEYEKLTQPEFKNNWIEIIKDLRKVYSGQLSYGANTNYSSYKKVESEWITFWDHLDFIGLDYYHPMKPDSIDLKSFTKQHAVKLNKLKASLKIYNKPIFFNEIGVPIADQGFEKPYEWVWPDNHKSNPDHQSLYLQSFFEAFDFKPAGIQIWRFMLDEEKAFKQGYILSRPKTVKTFHQKFKQMK
jgi:hypothetical protein